MTPPLNRTRILGTKLLSPNYMSLYDLCPMFYAFLSCVFCRFFFAIVLLCYRFIIQLLDIGVIFIFVGRSRTKRSCFLCNITILIQSIHDICRVSFDSFIFIIFKSLTTEHTSRAGFAFTINALDFGFEGSKFPRNPSHRLVRHAFSLTAEFLASLTLDHSDVVTYIPFRALLMIQPFTI
ncbi:hypothetical protein BJ165DRAFT_135614 [Panaeolus papilionaceus]|nr:hypothetical protein BJ165DRAFT_135614 [Panaeolus papilionaceus]